MPLTHILMEKRAPGVVWLTLNRPDALNALNRQLLRDLREAIEAIKGDEGARVVVITGKGRAFSAGADLAEVKGLIQDPMAMASFLEEVRESFNALEALDRPVIAAINGYALAGGLELVMVCDLAIAAESALLGDAHLNYGLLPGGGNSIRLPRLLGARRAKYLLYTAEFIPAREAERMGLVNQVVPDDQLEGAAMALADKLLRRSPLTLRAVKMLVNRALDMSLEGGLELEIRTFLTHLHSQDLKEGLAAFAEKRQPVFTGR